MIRSTDIYPPQSLSEALQNLMQLCLRHISAPRPMQMESIANLHASLRDCHRMALVLEDRARDAAEMEAIARDIEMATLPEALARATELRHQLERDSLARDLMGYAAHGAPGPVVEVHHQNGDVSLVKREVPSIVADGSDQDTLKARQRELQTALDAEDAAKIVAFRPRPRRVALVTCGNDDDGDAA